MAITTDRLAQLSVSKRQLIDRLLTQQGGNSAQTAIQPRSSTQTNLPLSSFQLSLWFLAQLVPDNPFYNVSSAVRLIGELDESALAGAFNEVVRRHEVLRTVFPSSDGKPFQTILPHLHIDIEKVDLQPLPTEQREQQLLQRATRDSQKPFDLATGPLLRVWLYRLAEQQHALLFVLHHIVSDGWSLAILTQEIAAAYELLQRGEDSPLTQLPELPIQYADYGLWQRNWLQGERLEKQLNYWRKQLANATELKLLTDKPRPAQQSFIGATEYVVLPAQLVRRLDALRQVHDVTLFMLLMAAFKVLLHRYTDQDNILVGTTIANRERHEVGGLIGFFANSLVLATDMTGNPSFVELLARLKGVTLGAYAHQDIPFEMLVEKLNIERDPSRNPLFQVMLTLQTSSVDDLCLSGLTVQPLNLGNDTTHFDLEFHLWYKDHDHLGGYISYNTDLFERETILRLLSHYVTLLEAIVDNPQQPILTLPLLTAQEQHWLNSQYPATKNLGQAYRCIHEAIAEQAAKSLVAPALHYLKQGAWHSLTLTELQAQVDQLVLSLNHYDLAMSDRVVIYLDPALASVEATLAIWRLGAVAVFLEPCAFSQKLLASGEYRLLLTLKKYAPQLQHINLKVIYLDEIERNQTEGDETEVLITPAVDPQQDACVLYSSGCKDVISHAQLWQRIQRLQAHFQLTPDDALLLQAYPGQDAFLWEIFWPLLTHSRLVIASASERSASDTLLSIIAQQSISHLHLTPGKLADGLAAADESISAVLQASTLRHVLCSGGLITKELVQAFYDCALNHSQLSYLYSPPEVFADVGISTCPTQLDCDYMPVGELQCAVRLLDAQQQAVPIGVAGQLFVGKEKANTNDWMATPEQGRWLNDGRLLLLGEKHTVNNKSLWGRGLRFELAKIQSALLSHPSVIACHLLSRRDKHQRLRLIAYVVAAQHIIESELHSHVLPLLPQAALPDDVVQVTKLPYTSLGQIDEAALKILPVLNNALVSRWQYCLERLQYIEQVRVVKQPITESVAQLYSSDLLLTENTSRERFTTTISAEYSQAVAESESGALALSDGGHLQIAADMPLTLTAALFNVVQRAENSATEKGIVLVDQEGGEAFIPYSHLLATAKQLLGGLQAHGLQKNDRVILQLENLAEHVCTFWACVLGGIVPVTVAIASSYNERNAVVNKLYNAWKLLEQPTVVASSRLVDQLNNINTLFDDEDLTELSVLNFAELQKNKTDGVVHENQPDDVVFYQLTSGSTGIPKCVQETHAGIIHHILGASQFNDYTDDDVSLNWLPLDHVVPTLTSHLKDTYLGLQQIIVKTQWVLTEPLHWLDLLEKHQVTLSWAPNFGFKLVSEGLAQLQGTQSQRSKRWWDLSSLRYIMNAGEQVTLPVVSDFMDALAPFGVKRQVMQPAYGMAEVCTAITYVNDFDTQESVFRVQKVSLSGVLKEANESEDSISFVSVGPPIPGVQIRITDASNKLLPENVIGRVQVKGQVVTPGYLNNVAANEEAFVGDGWFNTGDLGYIRHGSLAITGREKETIIVRGANFYCYEIEDVVNSITGVKATFSAACGVDDPATGTEGLAIFFVPEKNERQENADAIDSALIQSIKNTVARELGLAPAFVLPLAEVEFPKTTSGKIQRTQLKKTFADDQFDALIQRVERVVNNNRTMPEWFFKPAWQQRNVSYKPRADIAENVLIFVDQQGLSTTLVEDMGDMHCWQVHCGKSFARIDERCYQINPGDLADYQLLLENLAAEYVPINRIIHLWTYGDENLSVDELTKETLLSAQDKGVYSLLFLTQALVKHLKSSSIKLQVVSSNNQAVLAGDQMAVQNAPLRGLIKTISQEHPQIVCKHIDIDLHNNNDYVTHAKLIQREAQAISKDRDVAFRANQRWILGLAPVKFTKPRALPFKQGGVYVISGGLGGIGFKIARYLLENYHAKLILLGRNEIFEESGGKEKTRRKQRFDELNYLPGDLVYEVVDLTNPIQLQDTVERACSQWKLELDGIIHLAGVYHTRLLSEESKDSFMDTLRPKILGAWALQQLLADKEQGLFISFSSVNGFLGGIAAGAYAAANSFLEALQCQQQRNGLRSYCYAWSMWDETGMSEDYLMKEQARSQGYFIIDPEQGMDAFLAGLHAEQPQLMIGLDASNAGIRAYIAKATMPAERLYAYFTSSNADELNNSLTDKMIADDFATVSACDPVLLKELPLTEGGALDLVALADINPAFTTKSMDKKERLLPRSQLEKMIAGIWRDVLKIDTCSIHDSFFELGGQSILLIQVQSKLQQALEREVSVVDLLRYPTISALAAYLQQDNNTENVATIAKSRRDDIQQRATMQRDRRQQRTRAQRRLS